MAITIVKQPQQLQPVYNEIVYVLTSTLSTEDNFRFLVEVIIDGNIIATLEVPVNPEGYGVVDIHKHLQNYITNDFDPNSTTAVFAENSIIEYSVKFYEKFRPVWNYDGIYNIPTPTGGQTLEFYSNNALNDPNDYFNISDTVLVVQTPPFEVSSYSGLAVVTDMFFDSNQNTYVLETSKSFTVPLTFPNSGIITLPNQQSTISDNFASVTGKEAFNGVRNFIDFINWNFNDYNANTILNNGKWLTNAPSPYKVKLNSYIWLNVYSNVDDLIRSLKVTVNLQDYYFPITQGTNSLIQVPLAPALLNTLNWEDVNGDEPLVPFNLTPGLCFEVSVTAADRTDVLIQPHTFCVYESCSKYEDIQLVFMDKLGSFIPFHFDLVNRHNKSIERVNYQTDYGKYAPAVNNWKYNSYDRGTTVLDTIVTDVFTINSDWVNQETSDFLMTLIESPEVYWFKENGDVVGINLTVSNIERKQTINDQLVNYTLTFELSNKDKQQIG